MQVSHDHTNMSEKKGCNGEAAAAALCSAGELKAESRIPPHLEDQLLVSRAPRKLHDDLFL